MKRAAVIQFPGTNCEKETIQALIRCGIQPIPFFWNSDRSVLRGADGYVLAGGFSYEDRSRSGIIAALDPVMQILKEESEKGKPVLGICNGAQVLVETGMVPGDSGYPLSMALAPNRRIRDGKILGTGYYNAWSTIRAGTDAVECAFTKTLKPGERLTVPVAHAEGRFVIPEPLLSRMQAKGMIPFRYCGNDGNPAEGFPVNPNGSVWNAAGVCNERGNVLALMPHPERTPGGDPVFRSMKLCMEETRPRQEGNLSAAPPKDDGIAHIPPYSPPGDPEILIVDMIITNNEAVTVENTLNRLGIPVKISRKVHWEIRFSPAVSSGERKNRMEAIEKSGELYNSNKEFSSPFKPPEGSGTILVRENGDSGGGRMMETLSGWFKIEGIESVSRGVLWTIAPGTDAMVRRVLGTHILQNPFSHGVWTYG